MIKKSIIVNKLNSYKNKLSTQKKKLLAKRRKVTKFNF